MSHPLGSSQELLRMSQIPPILNLSEADVKKMLACHVHLGTRNLAPGMGRYVYQRIDETGIHVLHLTKTWEKLQLAARVIAAIENPKDVCVVAISSPNSQVPPYAQRAILKFAHYIGCRAIPGRFTPGTFTNQSQSSFYEPRLLIASDPLKDYQPMLEASYVNLPVVAFCSSHAPLRNVDIAIPCNTDGRNAIGLMYWLLAREVLRLRESIPRTEEWKVMVDMFIYRDPEDAEKQDDASGQKGGFGSYGGSGWDEGTHPNEEWGEEDDGGARERNEGPRPGEWSGGAEWSAPSDAPAVVGSSTSEQWDGAEGGNAGQW